jgi:TetR/AcrR family transcriptional regulator
MSARARRAREKEQRRINILDTARELLFEKGLNATTVNQIARRADLSVGAIYLYYKNKEDLYAALQVEALELLSQSLEDACRGKSNVENKIRAIAQAALKFSEEHKNYFDIIDYFLSSPETIFSGDIKAQIDAHGNQAFSLIAEVIAEGISKGIFKKVDPKINSVIFWCSIFGTRRFKKLQTTILIDVDFNILLKEMVERFIDGLRTGKCKDEEA